jgi:26S proteasome regulatory subunit N10
VWARNFCEGLTLVKLFRVTLKNPRCPSSANMTEACMLCLDTSEWMRNSDMEPTRMKAMIQAAQNVINAKENTGAETSIGVLSMAGDSPQVLTVLTKFMSNEFGRVYDALNVVKVKGQCEFKTSLLVAQLALKNR